MGDSIYLSNFSRSEQNIKIVISNKKNVDFEVCNSKVQTGTDYFKIDSKFDGKYTKYKKLKLEIDDDVLFHYFMDDEDFYFEFLQENLPDKKVLNTIDIPSNNIKDNIIVSNWTSKSHELYFLLKKNDGFIDLGKLQVEQYTRRQDLNTKKKIKNYDRIVILADEEVASNESINYQFENKDCIIVYSDDIDFMNANESIFFGHRVYTSAFYKHRLNKSIDFMNKCTNWLLKYLSQVNIEYRDDTLNTIKASIEDYIFIIFLEGNYLCIKIEPKPDEKYINAKKLDERAVALFSYLDS